MSETLKLTINDDRRARKYVPHFGGMKLKLHHLQILRRMARRSEHDGPESGPEMSHYLGHPPYWAAPKLKALVTHGFALELGTTSTGASCFSITDAGRTAVADEATPPHEA